PTTDADCTTPHRSLPSSPTRRSSDLNISLAFTGTSHSQHHRIHWCYVNHIKTSRTLRFIPRELPCVIDVFSQRIFFTNDFAYTRSEEHTSELQSRFDLVCRLLLEKKK